MGAAAQVCMQWMAKAVMVPARAAQVLMQTLGQGGSDARSDKSDGGSSVVTGSLPSFAPDDASCVDGDRNAADISGRDVRY